MLSTPHTEKKSESISVVKQLFADFDKLVQQYDESPEYEVMRPLDLNKQNLIKGLRLSASQTGDLKAIYEIGALFIEHGRFKDTMVNIGLHFLQQAAKENYVDAQEALATLYFFGKRGFENPWEDKVEKVGRNAKQGVEMLLQPASNPQHQDRLFALITRIVSSSDEVLLKDVTQPDVPLVPLLTRVLDSYLQYHRNIESRLVRVSQFFALYYPVQFENFFISKAINQRLVDLFSFLPVASNEHKEVNDAVNEKALPIASDEHKKINYAENVKAIPKTLMSAAILEAKGVNGWPLFIKGLGPIIAEYAPAQTQEATYLEAYCRALQQVVEQMKTAECSTVPECGIIKSPTLNQCLDAITLFITETEKGLCTSQKEDNMNKVWSLHQNMMAQAKKFPPTSSSLTLFNKPSLSSCHELGEKVLNLLSPEIREPIQAFIRMKELALSQSTQNSSDLSMDMHFPKFGMHFPN